MKTERRWMKSVLAESAKPAVALPWQRGQRNLRRTAEAKKPVAQSGRS